MRQRTGKVFFSRCMPFLLPLSSFPDRENIMNEVPAGVTGPAAGSPTRGRSRVSRYASARGQKSVVTRAKDLAEDPRHGGIPSVVTWIP